MDPRFTEYGSAVCTYIRHATAKEKEAIRKELADHMEDHAQALMDGGYPEDHAARVALASMGDPETVGRELDKEYPLRWLVLSRGLLVVILLLAVLLAFWVRADLRDYNTMRAAQNPSMESLATWAPPVAFHPLDLSHPIGDYATLEIFGVGLDQQEDGSYLVYLCTTSYPNDPRDVTRGLDFELAFSSSSSQMDYGRDLCSGLCNLWLISSLQPGDTLTAWYNAHGTVFHLDIPLPWKEVGL